VKTLQIVALLLSVKRLFIGYVGAFQCLLKKLLGLETKNSFIKCLEFIIHYFFCLHRELFVFPLRLTESRLACNFLLIQKINH
jgi:hypothetical protein